ncbi:MAG: hypothetical protein ACP5R2_07720 [Anaerolineae bacterium]
MKTSKRWFWIFLPTFALAGLVLIVFQTLELMGFEGQPVNLIRLSPAINLANGTQIGQTFLAPRPGLYRIDVLLYGYFRRNTQPVTFHLRKINSQEDLMHISFSASEVWGWHWKSFVFDPLSDSEGQTYHFFFESPTSTPEDAITLGGVEGDLYPHGTGTVNGQPIRADAAFKTYYVGVTWSDKLTALAHKITAGKPSLWGDIRFYVLLGIIYMLLVARLFSEIYRLRR